MEYEDGSSPFPLYPENHEYLILYKSRDGWPADYPERYPDLKDVRGPGAIILKPSDTLWEGEPIGKLWQPYPVRTIGKKRKNSNE